MNRRRALITSAAVASTGLALPFAASAQAAFPTKPVRITTPFPAGAGPEGVLRMLAEKLQRKWGQPVIIENKPGANGFIAIDAWKRQSAGTVVHELMHLDNVHLAAYPHLFKKLPYDPVADFETIAPLFRAYFFFAVPPGSKYARVADIVADARANPGKLNYGSWSVGNPVHLGSALLEAMTNIEMQHVIYKETSMLYTGVANGELNWALGSAATAGPLQRAGRIKFIAVTAPRRLAAYPDIPTAVESGAPAGYEVTGWTLLAAPKGTPRALADRLKADVDAALAEADVQQRFTTFGYEPFVATRDQFTAFVAAESAKYADVVKRAKASLD
jgi:tripartite-type tricarboxylate transporter receptor subunit TctC